MEESPRPPSPPLQDYKETAVFLLSSRRPLTSSSSSSRPLSSSSSSGVGGCEGGTGGPHWEDESTSSESKSRYAAPDHPFISNRVLFYCFLASVSINPCFTEATFEELSFIN